MPKIPVLLRILGLYFCIAQVLGHLSLLCGFTYVASLGEGGERQCSSMARFD